MKTPLRTTVQRILVTSLAAWLVSACQAPGDSTPPTSPAPFTGPTATQLNAVCDPFGGAGNTGPQNGLLAKLSYLGDKDDNHCNGLKDFQKYTTEVDNPIYLSQLYVPTREFDRGFKTAGGNVLTDQNGNTLYEYFSLHIESTIRLQPKDAEGQYQFALVSDDGAVLQADTGSGFKPLVDDDGVHPTKLGCARQAVALNHSSSLPIQVDWYQGPRYHLALILLWRKVDPTSTWHSDDDDDRDDDHDETASALNDPDCGRDGNDLYFDWHQDPSVPNQNWQKLLARGWSVVPAENYFLPGASQNPCNTGAQCFTDQFAQPQGMSSVDVLFMTDTSPDDYDRAGVSGYLHSFANQLPHGADFQVGVMVGHGSHGSAGRLMHAPSVSPVLSSKQLAIPDMESLLKKNLSHLPDDYASDEGELGMYSLTEALSSGQLQSAQAKGFFRPNAALSVVFLSDDPDQCAVDPHSFHECAGISPSSVLADLQALKQGKPLSVNAIVHTDHYMDRDEDEDEYGAGYIDLAHLAGGLALDMAVDKYGRTTSYEQDMQQLGQKVAADLTSAGSTPLRNTFALTHNGIDPSTVVVNVDGSSAQYNYDANQDQVEVPNSGGYGSVIQVNYCLMSSSPSPTPSPSDSVTPSPTPSPSDTVTPSPTPSPSDTVTPSPTPSPSDTVTPSPTPSPSDSVTPSPTPSPSSSCTGPFCGGGVLGA